jgi:hypothetical protein
LRPGNKIVPDEATYYRTLNDQIFTAVRMHHRRSIDDRSLSSRVDRREVQVTHSELKQLSVGLA